MRKQNVAHGNSFGGDVFDKVKYITGWHWKFVVQVLNCNFQPWMMKHNCFKTPYLMWRTKNEKELKQSYTKKPDVKIVGAALWNFTWINFVVSFKV
jgi:hypothetical protein